MPPSDTATQNTPLAPSVEKAYYRKCIELKRRLNEVEAANDEAKLRRVRLDRAIMKMRLERAFLLEQLGKRMEQNADGSEGSGDEGLATPPPDRPHRDKRRRPQESRPANPATATSASQPPNSSNANPTHPTSSQPPPGPPLHRQNSHQQQQPSRPTSASNIYPLVQNPATGDLIPANAVTQSGEHVYIPQPELARLQATQVPGGRGNVYALQQTQGQQQPQQSPYGQTSGLAHGVNGGEGGRSRAESMNRGAGAVGEAMDVGRENGDRRVMPEPGPGPTPGRESVEQGGFTAVNQ